MTKPALLAALLVLAISSSASAGGYVGLGVGTTPTVNDALDAVAAPFGRSLRGLLGVRIANLALEGAVNGFHVATPRGGDKTLYQASAALKLSVALTGPLEGFARGGI